MIVKKEMPHIVRLTYRQQPDDPDYGSCLWAFFDFDIDKFTLSIQSDCGEYGHRWPASKGESFMELCARMDDSYLETKMFGTPAMVNGETTVKQIMDVLLADRNAEEEWQFEPNELDAIDALKDKECELDGASPDGAGWILDEWANEYSLTFDELWEYVDTEYSGNQKKIIEVFREHIQPAIRTMLDEDDDTDGVLVYYSNGKVQEITNGLVMELPVPNQKLAIDQLPVKEKDITASFFNVTATDVAKAAFVTVCAASQIGVSGELERLIESCADQK